MGKIDKTVLKETKYIAVFTGILSLILQIIFVVSGNWDYTVLLGNILGYIASVGNFLCMGITVQKAVAKPEKEARKLIKLSQTLRLWGMFAVAMIGYLLPVFSTVAVVLPYLFPRLAINARPLFSKRGDSN